MFVKRSYWIAQAILLLGLGPSVYAQTSTENFSKHNGIAGVHLGGFTWVVFSSLDLQEVLNIHRSYRARGFNGDIVSGEVNASTYYRVVFGQYATLKQATDARESMRTLLPNDAWVLALKPGMVMLSRDTLLPLQVEVAQEEDADVRGVVGVPLNNPVVTETEAPGQASDGTYNSSGASRFVDDRPEAEVKPAPESVPEVDKSPPFLRRHFEAEIQFSNIYEDNIDHDDESIAVQSYGSVPALKLQFRSSASDPLFAFEYLVARHQYTNTERWDRISNAFRGVFKPAVQKALRLQTSVELSLKGSSEDRDISNQFQVVQEFEYRFTRRHRLQLYGTYRIKRFPDQPGVQDLKPNIGINFERSNSDGERFESGARYELNREAEERGNYNRWTFSVAYRSPEIKERSQFEVEVKHRRKFYMARFVEIEDEDFLRQDNRLSIGVRWTYEFFWRVVMEMGYEYETRGSNDPDKLYEANAFNLAMIYKI